MANKRVFILLLTAACADNPGASHMPTASADPARAVPSEGTSTLRWEVGTMESGERETLFGPAVAAHWRALSPDTRHAAIRAFGRSSAQKGDVYLRPSIALMREALPGGALAIVIRQAAHPGEPLIVISSSAGGMHALMAADAAARADTREDPALGTRVLSVLPGGEVDVREVDSIGITHVNAPTFTPSVHEGLAPLSGLARAVEGIEIQGIGTGILLRFH